MKWPKYQLGLLLDKSVVCSRRTICKVAFRWTLARLTARVWASPKLSVKTNMAVYNACVVSTLLYGSETWTTYAGQERRLNTFHLRSIRRILGISWQDKVTNADVLSRAGLTTMYTLLRQRRLLWLGHVRRMGDGRIPKYILYGELALGRRTTGLFSHKRRCYNPARN